MARVTTAYSTVSQAPMLQRVWQSMRMLTRFQSTDLMATAEAGETAVHKYLRALHGAGFLKIAQARVSGRPGSRDVWLLVRNSGPLAPIRRRDGTGVFDPNTQIAWGPDGKVISEPAPKPLPQAQSEALRQLVTLGSCKASPETMHALLRAGLVTLAATDAGRKRLQDMAPPRSQREGRARSAAVRGASA